MTVVAMSQSELTQLDVLQRIARRELRVSDAAVLLRLCPRQIYRLLSRVRSDGATGLVSRKRGRPSSRRFTARWRCTAIKRCSFSSRRPLPARWRASAFTCASTSLPNNRSAADRSPEGTIPLMRPASTSSISPPLKADEPSDCTEQLAAPRTLSQFAPGDAGPYPDRPAIRTAPPGRCQSGLRPRCATVSPLRPLRGV